MARTRTVAFVVAVLAVWPSQGHARAGAISADFVPAKSTFLSSEHPRGTVHIRNGSNEALTFNTAYGTSGEDSRATGGLLGHDVYDISGNRYFVVIAPHGSYDGTVLLPPCTLLGQPCSVAAVLSVALWPPDGRTLVVKTPAHSYDIVADPTATFVDRGLRDNRPLIVTQGESNDELDATLIIEVHPARSEPSPDSADSSLIRTASAIAARDGIVIAGAGTSTDAQGWYATITVRRASTQRQEIAKALADLKRELGRRVRSITHSFTVDRFSFEPALERAAAEGDLEARRFADVIGVQPLQSSNVAGEDYFAVGSGAFSSLDVGQPEGLRFDEAPPEPMSVRVRTAVVRSGSRAAPAVASGAGIDAEFRGQAVELAGWPNVNATIEADRPELFVAAGVDEDSALATNRVPEELSLAYARRRAEMFAALLGAKLGIVSMVVLPRVADQVSGARIRPLGLAMTMEPSDPGWNDVPNGEAPSGHAPSGNVAGAPSASPPPFAPIDVADPESTITTSARVESPAVADGLRVDVTVEPTREAPDPSNVAARFKNHPLVTEFAIDGAALSQVVRYRIVLKSTAATERARIVELIREAYGANARTLNTVETRLIRDCRPLERRVVADAIGQARARAAAQATSDHLRLVRLLLAVELPFGADFDGCFDHAAAPALRFLPGYASTDELHVWGAVSLTFRTQPER